MGLWSKIFGLVGGGAVAGATAEAVQPVLENVRQDAWEQNAIRVIDLQTLGALLAQELASPGDAYAQASRDGFSSEKVDYLKKLAETAPGSGELIELLRRAKIDPGTFDLGLKKAGMRQEFRTPLQQLKDTILSPADLANAVQQGFIPDPGYLPGLIGGSPPFNIPFHQVGLDTATEFDHNGIDQQRATVLAELTGLPPGPIELLQMLNRGIITDASYYVGIREGHTKTKWSDALKELRKAIATPTEAAGLRLRQWITAQESYNLGALSGADPALMEHLWLLQGRPLSPGELQTAFNRGLIDKPRFLKGIAESDVRDEWGETAFELRRRYPTVFVLRQLTQTGAVTVAQATQILEFEGYDPTLAGQIATAWAGQKTSKQKELAMGAIETLYQARYIDQSQASDLLTKLGYDSSEITLILELGDAQRVKRFLDTAVGRIHTKFVTYRIDAAFATNELNALNISSQAVADLMAEWRLERDVNQPQLTYSQYAAAYHYGVITRDEAITGITTLGYTQRDAQIIVDTREHGTPSGQPL
jgi:hypothetical protein